MQFKVFILFIFLALIGCGDINYDEVSREGRFEGRLFVMWVGEGSAYSGDGTFLFVPNPSAPLRFSRFDDQGKQGGEVIQPEIMYTDGGSIPRIATVFKGFSPWGYAPAYMVHDWVFIAHHCNIDGTPTPEEEKHKDLTFEDSAMLIAEAIKALQVSGQVARNDVAGSAISSAVAGPISRSLWQRKGACQRHRVSEKDRLAALQAFPRSVRATLDDVGLDPRLDIPDTDLPGSAILIGEFGPGS